MKDKAWVDQATMQDLINALRLEPADSELFSDKELAEYFWKTYRQKVAELYGRPNSPEQA